MEEYILIEAAKKDLKKFSVLYEMYFESIFRFIFRQINNESIADDLTSQTFLQAMVYLNKYEYRNISFAAWLYKIALNEINKHYRKTKTTLLFSLEENLIENLIDDAGHIFTEENINELVKFLEQLSTDEVTILQLRFFEDKSFKEIAYILDLSESNAKMRTYRSLQKLKKYFSQHTGC